jgi:thioredoxin reductase (NADPH)
MWGLLFPRYRFIRLRAMMPVHLSFDRRRLRIVTIPHAVPPLAALFWATVTDQASGIADHSRTGAMFDYDARPVTPQLMLVGSRTSAGAYSIRDFLTRNGRPYEWVDAGDFSEALEPSRLPLCILPDGTRLEAATIEQIATGLGMVSDPLLSEYDLVIVGAGPAGLGAAVYAASEGLRAVAVEAVAPGGQAGTTSMIENYLGFPNGISGNELATRATSQARRFGAEILLARLLTNVSAERGGYVATLSDGAEMRARAIVLASGVEWRRLDVPGVEDLLGAGVYYGAGPSEAMSCSSSNVVIVGGGNSAGQAAVRFSKYAQKVTLLVRGRNLEVSMSQYLIDHISAAPNIEVRVDAQVVGLEADGRLREVITATTGAADSQRLAADALFICIGGIPRTDGTADLGLMFDGAGYIRTGTDVAGAEGWQLAREPLPLETNRPGLFAAGDVRSGSIKRCAAAIGEGAMAVALVHRRLEETGGE